MTDEERETEIREKLKLPDVFNIYQSTIEFLLYQLDSARAVLFELEQHNGRHECGIAKCKSDLTEAKAALQFYADNCKDTGHLARETLKKLEGK